MSTTRSCFGDSDLFPDMFIGSLFVGGFSNREHELEDGLHPFRLVSRRRRRLHRRDGVRMKREVYPEGRPDSGLGHHFEAPANLVEEARHVREAEPIAIADYGLRIAHARDEHFLEPVLRDASTG